MSSREEVALDLADLSVELYNARHNERHNYTTEEIVNMDRYLRFLIRQYESVREKEKAGSI